MAVSRIQNLNYMTVGRDRIFLNVDAEFVGVELSDEVGLLASSGDSAVSADQNPN